MPVFGACFLLALFAVMQRYKDCVNEQKEMPPFIPFLASIYIMYARTFIISYLIYYYLLASPRSSMFFSFPSCSYFANLRPIVQPLANSQIMEHLKSPFLSLCKPLRLFFGFVFFCSLLFRLHLLVARTDPSVFPSLVSLFSVEHIS